MHINHPGGLPYIHGALFYICSCALSLLCPRESTVLGAWYGGLGSCLRGGGGVGVRRGPLSAGTDMAGDRVTMIL